MSLQNVINNLLSGVIGPLVVLLVGVAIVLFVYGLVGYLKSGLGDKEAVNKARNMMIWGVVIIFVMVSVWGFVQVLQWMFFGRNAPVGPPDIPLMDGNTSTGGESMLDWFGGLDNGEEAEDSMMDWFGGLDNNEDSFDPNENEHQTIPW